MVIWLLLQIKWKRPHREPGNRWPVESLFPGWLTLMIPIFDTAVDLYFLNNVFDRVCVAVTCDFQ